MRLIIRMISAASIVGLALASPALAVPAQDAEGVAYFEKHIRPLFAKHCYQCHSATATKLQANLLLDTQAGVLDGGDRGAAIEAGDPDASLLLKAVSYEDADLQMPPKYKLKESEIAALHRWIKMGAPDPRSGTATPKPEALDIEKGRSYWAFVPPREAPLPRVKNTAWPSDPMDRLLLVSLEASGLTPAGDADRATLIRRATLDLIGLPPTIEEIDAFVNDPAPDQKAFAKVVDRLLASDHFGERWGRHWLDIARYAESVGGARNWAFPHAWRYRDYVIKSFNDDKPYDQFITEQLAGDLMPARDATHADELKVATAFLALGPKNLNETNAAIFKMDVVDEQIDTTGRAMMALTLGCARCHDHKFDPITSQDYYAVAGIFASTVPLSGQNHRNGGNQNYVNNGLLAKLSQPDTSGDTLTKADQRKIEELKRYEKRIENVEKEIADANQRIAALRKRDREIAKQIQQSSNQRQRNRRDRKGGEAKPIDSKTLAAERKSNQRELQTLQKSIRPLRKRLQDISKKRPGGAPEPTNLAMSARDAQTPADCKFNVKGDPTNLGDPVPRGFIAVATVPGSPVIKINPEQSGRLELAQWIARPENPLTARVMANRIWHHLFGRGIVATVDNFGETGMRPTHPQLLDHLALRLIENKWSVKRTIRQIMLSRAYRMNSDAVTANMATDPDNRMFWRMNVRRLEVEAIRDSMLAVSGELETNNPGRSIIRRSVQVRGAVNKKRPTQANPLDDTLVARYRSVYTASAREYLPEMYETFDFTRAIEVTGRRDVTTVAPQALFMMNNRFVLDRAAAAAKRMHEANAPTNAQRAALAYRWTLGRLPTQEEAAGVIKYISDREADPSLQKLDGDAGPWQGVFHALFAGAEFRYVH